MFTIARISFGFYCEKYVLEYIFYALFLATKGLERDAMRGAHPPFGAIRLARSGQCDRRACSNKKDGEAGKDDHGARELHRRAGLDGFCAATWCPGFPALPKGERQPSPVRHLNVPRACLPAKRLATYAPTVANDGKKPCKGRLSRRCVSLKPNSNWQMACGVRPWPNTAPDCRSLESLAITQGGL